MTPADRRRTGSRRSRSSLLALALLALVSVGQSSPADVAAALPAVQEPAGGPQAGVLSGKVVLAPDSTPLAGLEVSLHVITPDSGGVVATRSSDRMGRFRFELDPVAGDAAESTVYLLTTRYRDVIYIGQALHRFSDVERELEIVVYEPKPVGALPLSGRRTLVRAADSGLEIVDVFELVNDSDSTLVRAPDAGSGWEVALPSGAGRTASASIGFGSGAYELQGDRILVDLSVPPGGRTFSVSYRLNGPVVRLVLDRPLDEQLVIAEEGAGILVEGLAPAGSVEIEGAPFARFAGRNREAGDVSTLRLTSVRSPRRYAWVALVLGLALAAAAVLAWRVGNRASAP